MPCTVCNRDKPAIARGLCAACYARWRKTGTTDYQRRGRRSVCNVGGCAKRAVAGGLCDTHRKRLERHGHVEETRPDSWGAKHKHPLFNSWAHARRHRAQHPMVKEWADDFLQFAVDLGERPSPKHKLFVADPAKPLGPTNYVWKRAVTERVDGEAPRAHQARAARVSRALNIEAHHGYSLKKNYGLSREDYAALLAGQRGRCAICGCPERRLTKGKATALAVDHCHVGGHVRGLLCADCNRGLGMFGDDPKRLAAAIEYLERHAPKEQPSDEG